MRGAGRSACRPEAGAPRPPRQLARLTGPCGLLVLGYDQGHAGSFFRPDPAVHMMIRARASVLVLLIPALAQRARSDSPPG